MNKNLLKIYGVDASEMKGAPKDVFFPESVEEVCDIVRKNDRIVIRGGATGLVGGCVPQNDVDVVLDLSKMTEISNLNVEHELVEVEAGVILDELQDYLEEFGLEFPIKPSSHAVATIGGMISTDAVGNHAVKYGKTSNWVKWVEIVDCCGKVDRKGITELSDYSGMEGITGVIVRACLKLSKIQKRTGTLLEFKTIEELVDVVRSLKRNRFVSMLEFIDRGISERLGLGMEYHLIIEYEDGSGELSGKEYSRLLEKRDNIAPLLSGEGYHRIEDPKVLLDRSISLIKWCEENGIPIFGHIGVGIFHPRFDQDKEKLIPEMMKIVRRLGGQISGEHGIGVLKKAFVDPNDKKILVNVKKRTDVLNKFNIGKVI